MKIGIMPPDLTLEEKAAQLVFARLGANFDPPKTVEEDADRVADLVERYALGGIALFRGRLPSTPRMLKALQERSQHPLLVGTDMERGVGEQIRGATTFPHAMAYSHLDDAEERLEASARVAAREALACGIHIAFAPVADVNRDPDNPIIGTRAFESRPDEAARLLKAYLRGCQTEGLLTTAKHFPGHGNTHEDSHAGMPVVRSTREELEHFDFVPFRTAIDAGVDLMMTAHIAYPALDDDQRPATLSRPILHDLLREDMGFQGLVITDSLIMEGIRHSHDDPGEQAVALVNAGVDVLLDPTDEEAVIEGLVRGVESGALPEARLEEAVGRVWVLKERLTERFGASVFSEPTRHVPMDEVGSMEHRQLAREVAFHAVTGVDEATEAGLLPLQSEKVLAEGMLVVLMQQQQSLPGGAQQPLAEAIHTAFPEAQYEEVDADTDPARLQALQERARDVQHIVLAPIVKPAAWQGDGLRPAQEDFIRSLAAERPVILASLGSPYVLDDFPQAAARLCTYSDTDISQQALVTALVGTHL